MSKRDDDSSTDMEVGMTTAERRRRRRRGGLRVPSDNVPRRTNPPVVPPVPEDPTLAMSIAYSFSSDTSDSIPLVAIDSASGKAGAGSDAEHTLEASPTVIDSPIVAIEAVDFDAKTREMAAVSLEALGGGEPAVPGGISIRFREATDRMATLHGGEPELGNENTTIARSPVPHEIINDTSSSPVSPLSARSPIVSDRKQRLQTVALTEDDLEEVREAVRAATGEDIESRKREPYQPEITLKTVFTQEGETVAADREDTQAIPDAELQEVSDRIAAGEEDAAGDVNDAVLKHGMGISGAEPSPAPASSAGTHEVAQGPVRALHGKDPGSAPQLAPQPLPPPTPAQAKTPPTPPPAPPKKDATVRTEKPSSMTGQVARAGSDRTAPRAKPWFTEIFDEDYLRTLPFLTPQATQAEAEFAIETLALTPGAQVLDVGCGYGRHAMELAARGYHVVGLDLSTPLLVRGGEEATRRGLHINFVRGDMRELDFDAQFDAAYCLFSTFGYFDDDTNKKTIAHLARALRPGGRVMLELLNRDYVISDLPTRVWWEGDGCVVLEEVDLNYFSSRIQVSRSVVFDDGRQLEQEISIRAYSLHEVGKLMHGAGFRVLEISGGYQTRGRFFGNQSRHIIVVAERKDVSTPSTP